MVLLSGLNNMERKNQFERLHAVSGRHIEIVMNVVKKIQEEDK